MGRMGSCVHAVDDWGVERPVVTGGSLEAAAGPVSLRDIVARAAAAAAVLLLLLLLQKRTAWRFAESSCKRLERLTGTFAIAQGTFELHTTRICFCGSGGDSSSNSCVCCCSSKQQQQQQQ